MPLQSERDPDFDARWAAWLARSAAHDRAVRRRLVVTSRPRSRSPWSSTRCSLANPTKRLMIMVKRPDHMKAFEFAVLSGLRAAQLQRGCTPRVEQSPKVAVTAQHEIAERKVEPLRTTPEPLAPSNE